MYSSYGLLIDGQWRAAENGATQAVISPVSEAEIGHIAAAQATDVAAAIAAAEQALPRWQAISAWERGALLRRGADRIREQVENIAYVMSTETGKPLAEARGETQAAADQFEWYAEEARRVYGHTIAGRAADQRLSVIYQPVGVCAVLSAWNFPALLPARKIAAALAAGCTVVARPASEAPGACFAMVQALMDAGLPAGVVNILSGRAQPIAEALMASPVVRKISFTGSVPVGKTLLRQAAEGVKRVSMELGGHAPVIVHADADPEFAAQTVAAAKFRNCGQVCISPSRFYVHHSIKARFEQVFAETAQQLVVGDGLQAGVTTGPLIRANALQRCEAMVADALSHGARLLAGGARSEQHAQGYFWQPTVLTDVPNDALIMSEEPFAPIAPIQAFDDVSSVIARANALPFGLAAYVFSNDAYLAQTTAEQLQAGMVGINEVLLATAEAPFGGIKESGYGREGGALGIMDYLEPKYIKHRLIPTGGHNG